jgi:hypothetical protein
MYYVMHMTRVSQSNKIRETYAKSVKTKQSGLAIQTIRFFQTQHINKETNTMHFKHSINTH